MKAAGLPHGARRAIRYGDDWIPTARGDIAEVLPKFREIAREAGRDPASIEITSFGLGEDLDRVKRLAEMGVARVVPMFPPEKADARCHSISRSRRRRARCPRRCRFTFAATNSRWRKISSGGISRGATIASAAGATDLVVPVAIDTQKI
jgi:alkanesulfonate monooxygenase SsuD/methylene tetrahydromethanopterin reductase-like flavin-dependent oxidoreductase (luciferase family)